MNGAGLIQVGYMACYVHAKTQYSNFFFIIHFIL